MKRFLITTLLASAFLLAPPSAWSQDATQTPNSAAYVPLEPEALNPEEVVSEIILVDMPASDVIDLLETLTGKIILRRQDITAKINFNSQFSTLLVLSVCQSVSGFIPACICESG